MRYKVGDKVMVSRFCLKRSSASSAIVTEVIKYDMRHNLERYKVKLEDGSTREVFDWNIWKINKFEAGDKVKFKGGEKEYTVCSFENSKGIKTYLLAEFFYGFEDDLELV